MGMMASELPFYLQKGMVFSGVEVGYEKARYCVFGVPYDLTSSFRPGCRYGPEAVRRFSANIEANSYRKGFDISTAKIADLGDIIFEYKLPKMLRKVEKVVEIISASGKSPIMIGGEHSFTYSCFKSLAEKSSCIIVLDAHFDLRDEYLGLRFNHASYLRRLVEKFPNKPVAVLGVRGFDPAEEKFAKDHGIMYIKASEMDDRRRVVKILEEAVGHGRPYISVDIDVVDPGFCPGVGNPEPEGLNPTQVIDLVSILGAFRPAGLDVVEVNPLFDNGATAALAARIIFETVASAEET
ncbi:agmatinase [Candidatus Caldarchaeum subterraneum]|uniref:Agmatinase n=1 Tax=Caldiarchaeum subterraneum TaxID=311458 RepID=E6N8P0_CALS0|nr:agmatinase [Candidatus Caldarchaeum subterraneum]BAJ51364.1 agmatinase [Candidatus Caldarchaeum subterraneum]